MVGRVGVRKGSRPQTSTSTPEYATTPDALIREMEVWHLTSEKPSKPCCNAEKMTLNDDDDDDDAY